MIQRINTGRTVTAWRVPVYLCAAVLVGSIIFSAISVRADTGMWRPSGPASKNGRQHSAPYSVVIFRPPASSNQCRRLLQSVKEMGVTRTLASVYWWQMDTMGGDYWKKMGYAPGELGEQTRRGFKNYINISLEMGMIPSVRVGMFRSSWGLYHPMDPTRSEENYGQWLRGFATEYRGKIEHYIIGDEMNKTFSKWNWHGTPEEYLKAFIPLAGAIHTGDPGAEVSPASASSSPASDWIIKLVKLGLPDYADGIACHFPYRVIENLVEIKDMMKKVRGLWPEVKFYSSGFGYVDNTDIHDIRQACIVAQCAFTLWDIGWDSFPYYTYKFSNTADTHQNFGLMRPAVEDKPAVYSYAWKYYQTIARTFYDRDELKVPDFTVSLKQADIAGRINGVDFKLVPPDPVFRIFNRNDQQLIIYMAYRRFREPVEGKWDIILNSTTWTAPEQVTMQDYTVRVPCKFLVENGKLIIENVTAGLNPVIIVLKRTEKKEKK